MYELETAGLFCKLRHEAMGNILLRTSVSPIYGSVLQKLRGFFNQEMHKAWIITAVANDIGTEVIFLRQLIAQARPEDVAMGISTSGGSRNIVMALEEARKRKMLTLALLGYDGGEILRRLTDGIVVNIR